MTNQPLTRQSFPSTAVTIVPALNFFQQALNILPGFYKAAPKFIQAIFYIASVKQSIYDIIRSVANIYNLYSINSQNPDDATPKGIYLRMLAVQVNAPFSEVDDDSTVTNSIINRINYVVSRGTPLSFFNYFNFNSLGGYFNNVSVQETNNATIFFNVPVPNNPLINPNPFELFRENMERLKAAGIKIVINSTLNIPLFQLADLYGNVAPENAGFAGLDVFGEPVGGGFYKNL